MAYLTVLDVLLTAGQGPTHSFRALRTQPRQVSESLHHHCSTAQDTRAQVRASVWEGTLRKVTQSGCGNVCKMGVGGGGQ